MPKYGQSITILQCYMVLITSVGFMNHVLITPILLEYAGRDAWISAALGMLLIAGILPVMAYIMKQTGDASLLEWWQRKVGKKTAVVLFVPVAVYLYGMGAISLKDSLDWLRIAYLPQTPGWIIAGAVMLVSSLAAHSGIRSIAIMNGVLLPFVVLFGYFVMYANMGKKDYAMLFPIFDHGYWPAVKGAFYACGGLIEMIVILWMKQYVTAKVRWKSLFLLAFLLVGLTVGPITGAIMEFGPHEAMKQRYPAYEEWRLVEVGKYIHHVDFLSLYQWLVGAVIRIALSLFLIVDMCKPDSRKNRNLLLFFVAAGMLLYALYPISDMFFL